MAQVIPLTTPPPSATNILLLPLVEIMVETGTNEDWVDGLAFFADDEETIPLDLTGIEFEMEMRTLPPSPTVVVRGHTKDGTINVLQHTISMNIPAAQMMTVPPGDYVFDILAFDGYRHRIIVKGTNTVVFQGITR